MLLLDIRMTRIETVNPKPRWNEMLKSTKIPFHLVFLLMLYFLTFFDLLCISADTMLMPHKITVQAVFR